MFDVYAWIGSEEIREYLRGNYKLSFKERLQPVRTAHRPGDLVRLDAPVYEEPLYGVSVPK